MIEMGQIAYNLIGKIHVSTSGRWEYNNSKEYDRTPRNAEIYVLHSSLVKIKQ
jgi:hypothetical protein